MSERLFHCGRSGCVDPDDERFWDRRRSHHVRAAGGRRLEPLAAQSRRIAMDFLKPHCGTVSCASGYVASDMEDTVFQCLALPGVPDGTLPWREMLVCTGQEFDGWEGVADTCDGVGLGDNCGTEGVHGMAGNFPRVWNDSTSFTINNLHFTCSSESSPASVPPATASHDCDGFTLQEGTDCHLRRELRGQVECKQH